MGTETLETANSVSAIVLAWFPQNTFVHICKEARQPKQVSKTFGYELLASLTCRRNGYRSQRLRPKRKP